MCSCAVHQLTTKDMIETGDNAGGRGQQERERQEESLSILFVPRTLATPVHIADWRCWRWLQAIGAGAHMIAAVAAAAD